jgi:hypothetical protein
MPIPHSAGTNAIHVRLVRGPERIRFTLPLLHLTHHFINKMTSFAIRNSRRHEHSIRPQRIATHANNSFSSTPSTCTTPYHAIQAGPLTETCRRLCLTPRYFNYDTGRVYSVAHACASSESAEGHYIIRMLAWQPTEAHAALIERAREITSRCSHGENTA